MFEGAEGLEDKNASRLWSISESQRLVCTFVIMSLLSKGVEQLGKTRKEWVRYCHPKSKLKGK